MVKNQHRSEEMTAKNPKQRIPFVELNSNIYTESQSILRTLAAMFEKSDYYPESLTDRSDVDEWMEYVDFHVGKPISVLMWENVFSGKMGISPNQYRIDSAKKHLVNDLSLVESKLQKNQFLCGSKMTLADISLLPSMSIAEVAGVNLKDYPKIREWLSNLDSSPSWNRVVDKRQLVNW